MPNDLIPSNRPRQLQIKWSIDLLIKKLEAYGIDVSLRVVRLRSNEVGVSIATIKSKRAKDKLDEQLFKLYGIVPEE